MKANIAFLIFTTTLATVLLGAMPVAASQLTYTPVNPAFGGNPLNGGFLLSQAEAQNKFKEQRESLTIGRDPMEYFQESLVRRVLNNLANKIIDDTFGGRDSELTDGFYQFGDYAIEIITSGGENVTVSITNLSNGNSTIIDVPAFNF
jgi:curli production assembly/transport component CsgF